MLLQKNINLLVFNQINRENPICSFNIFLDKSLSRTLVRLFRRKLYKIIPNLHHINKQHYEILKFISPKYFG